MTKNRMLAIFTASILLFTCTEAQSAVQQADKCAGMHVRAKIGSVLDGFWTGAVAMNEMGKPDPTSALKAMSVEQFQRIKSGIHSEIEEIYALSDDVKLPADCLAIVKSAITLGNKTYNTPTYPLNYGIHKKSDGTIDVDINNKSLDADLIRSVTRGVMELSQQK